MLSEKLISELVDIMGELAETGGSLERTAIFPSLTVIDPAPAALSAEYIIIEDDEGFYIPALKVPGVTYLAGDLVNVLFIKGTEPIAFQQAAGSSGSNSAITIRKNSGANVGTRPRLNFIEGSGVSMTIADDSVNNEVDITIISGGGAITSEKLYMYHNFR